jgi:hypothetical protein
MVTLKLSNEYIQMMITDYSLFELWLNTQIYDQINIDRLELIKPSIRTKLKKLPNKIAIDTLFIHDTQIEYLPNDIIIDYNLYASNSKLKELPNNLKLHDLSVRRTPITYLPEDLIVTNKLNISFTNIKQIPNGCLSAKLFNRQ